ncbi:hypothetical protein U2F10_02725 [Leptothoe sp. EHU-05/26/07-4]
MAFEKGTMRLEPAQKYAFPYCDIRDCKENEGNYQATLFGKKFVDSTLKNLCLKLANELYRLAEIGHRCENSEVEIKSFSGRSTEEP